MKSKNEEQKNSQMVVEKTNVTEDLEVPVNNSPEDLPLPVTTDELPATTDELPVTTDELPAESNVQNLANTSYIPRIMKYSERVRTPTSENVVNLIDDIYNSAIDDSVILIDDIVNAEDENSIQILDDTSSPIIIDDTIVLDVPSTSTGSKRKQGISETSPPKRKRVCSINLDTEPPNQSAVGKRDCPICLEGMDNKEVSSTICGHIFCTSCIKEAIEKTKKCPNCRKKLNLKKIHPLYL